MNRVCVLASSLSLCMSVASAAESASVPNAFSDVAAYHIGVDDLVQVLSGDKYTEQAQNNRVREIRIPAPRGEILDRNGNVLVDNRTALWLQVDPDQLPRRPADRNELFVRLGEVIGFRRVCGY